MAEILTKTALSSLLVSRTVYGATLTLVGECNALLASGSDPTCHAGCVKKTYCTKPSDHDALTPRPFSLVLGSSIIYIGTCIYYMCVYSTATFTLL